MEKRIKNKLDKQQVEFKSEIRKWFDTNNLLVDNEKKSEFLKFVYDYDSVSLCQDDFQKRKRVKNIVPQCDRCEACRADGDQCTRRQQVNEKYCGTHRKGTPNGIMNVTNIAYDEKHKKIEVWYEEINGIYYYIDDSNNVYKNEDIMNNKESPDIIGQWVKNDKGEYTIPGLGI
jgi:hypothetical protein|tara:strand:- start:1775 stop:2296 length:522 start_codon:yes stop_codon:yes gene_type:complete